MGHDHPLDGITNPKYKLLHFLTTEVFCKEKKALAFYRDRCCHLVLCLQLILFHCSHSLKCVVPLWLSSSALILKLPQITWPNEIVMFYFFKNHLKSIHRLLDYLLRIVYIFVIYMRAPMTAAKAALGTA